MTIDQDIAAAKRELATAEANGDGKAAKAARSTLIRLQKREAADARKEAAGHDDHEHVPAKKAAPSGRTAPRKQTT